MHLGLLFIGSGKDRRRVLAHQPWHDVPLYDDNPSKGLWVRPTVPVATLEAVALRLRQMHATAPGERLPFGFEKGSTKITRRGRWAISGGSGLNCSTFVMVVFESVNCPLIDLPTWEERGETRRTEDIGVQMSLVDALASDHPKVAERLKGEVGATRFRPEEIAAATGLLPHAVVYSQAEPEGRQVAKRVRAL